MIFLPIVERELRVASRRRATFIWRLVLAILAILIGAGVLLANLNLPDAVVGSFIFRGLAGLALIYCLQAGRNSTADSLSEEKREGTLGLLFLTDLTGFDVVLGKLAATSLNALYGLLAVFPVIAIPLLMGGITYGEFWRLVLALLVTFLFSLAIGIFASALSRDLRSTMAINFALLLLFTLVLPVFSLAILAYFHAFVSVFCFTSPVFAFAEVFAQPYKAAPADFWISIGVIHALTWWMLYQAGRIVPRSWQDQPKPQPQPRAAATPRQSFWHKWSFGAAEKLPAHRKKLLDVNAFLWLTARARLKPMHVWVFLFLLIAWCVCLHFVADGIIDDVLDTMTALLLNTTLKLWLALEAGQQLARDKKSGSLELILSTPLGERDLVNGQMLALRRQFLIPTVVVMLVDLFLMHGALSVRTSVNPDLRFLWLASIVLLPLDMIALAWYAMSKALTSRTYNQSLVTAAITILWLPWVIFGFVTLAFALFLAATGSYAPIESVFHPGWFFIISLAADFFFGSRARNLLFLNMRSLASERYVSTSAPAEPKIVKDQTRQRKGARRWKIAAVALIVGVAYWLVSSSHKFPPPVVASASLSQGRLQVFPSGSGALFLMPDSSVWSYGQTGITPGRLAAPQKFAMDHWASVAASPEDFIGIRNDGTLWQETKRFGSVGELTQLGPERSWRSVSSGGWHGCAIARDGSLWVWGNNQSGQLGMATPQNQAIPVQLGTSTNWAAVCCVWSATLALKTDGTLWAWGRTIFFGSSMGAPTINNVPEPTQVCSESNWTGFVNAGPTIKVRNQKGELWEPFFNAPNPDLGATATCRLAGTTEGINQMVFGFCGVPTAFQIQTNGTLWQKEYAVGSTVMESAQKWKKVSRRSDWLSLWGGGGTVFGLTADGTLWTWGYDFSREAPDGVRERFNLLREQISSALGTLPPGARMGMSRAALWQYEKTPRAILRLSK